MNPKNVWHQFSHFLWEKTVWKGEEEGLRCLQSGGSNAQSFDRRWDSPRVHPIWSCTCVHVQFAEGLRRGEEWMFIFNLARPLIQFHTLSLQRNWWVNWVGKLLGMWKIGSRGSDQWYNVQLDGGVSQKYRHNAVQCFY